MSYTYSFVIALASTDTGLTLRGQYVDTAGADVGAAFTAGFRELGEGMYTLVATVPDGHRGTLEIMDDADGSLLAVGAVNPEVGENADVKTSTRSTLTDAQAAAAAALAAYDAATGTDVTNATSGLSTFDASTDEVNVGEVKGVPVAGVADFKATGFSTHTAADAATAVWAAGTRTLTGFGTLVADVVAGVWGAAQRTLTAFGFVTDANVTQVGGAAVASADDLKADVSSLATSADIDALNDLSAAEVQGIIDALETHGDGAWSTADLTGISTLTEAQVQAIVATLNDLSEAEVQALLTTLQTHGDGAWATADVSGLATSTDIDALNDLSSVDAQAAAAAALTAYDPPTKAELDAAELAIRGADNDTLKTLSDGIDGISAGDATEAKQNEIIASLDEAKGTTFDTATDSLEAIRDRGDIAWLASAGSGVRTVVFTVSDGSGTLAGSLKCHVEDGSGNLVAGPLTTDSLGQVTFFLDDAEGYEFVTPSTAIWQGAAQEFDVSASGSQAITLTAQTLPVPSSADKYTIIINAADEFADSIGASGWSIKVIGISPRGLSTANLVQLTERNAITVDDNGQASFEVSQETETVTLAITPTLADGTTGATETITVEIDADKADDEGRIYLADLMTD